MSLPLVKNSSGLVLDVLPKDPGSFSSSFAFCAGGSLSTSFLLPPFSKSPLERVPGAPSSLDPKVELLVRGTAGTERSVPDLVRPPVRKSSLLAQFTWFWKNASLSLNDMKPVTMSVFSRRVSRKIQALNRAGDVILAPNE